MRKRKDSGLKAIICLAVATLAVGGASVALSHMDRGQGENLEQGNNNGNGSSTGTVLEVSGDTKVQSATLNEDGTYTLVIKEEGYIGEMIIEATYSSDGKTLLSYNVLSHTETDGIGTKVNEDAYKSLLANVQLPIAANGMDISAILGIEAEDVQSGNGAFVDGIYYAQATPDDNGNYAFVTVTVADGKVTSVVWDEMYGGALKSVLSVTGKYVMTENGPVWKEQADAVGAYVVENQSTTGIMNENGYTDVVSGVSINIYGAVTLIEDCMAQASGAGLKDGVYEVKADADDKGNYAFVTVTVEGGKITSVVWDEMYGGSLKSVLSQEGKYVMKPIWDTQAKAVGAYVVEHQGTAGIMDEKGYTDVVSGVSINIYGAVSLIDQAIAKANGQDGTYEVKADADDKGNYAFVSVTIEGGKITAVTWDEVYNGSLKSTLSKEGKYVMKPIWATQAASVGQYVVDNQSTAGIMNENGYTDVVSGVSINIYGAVSLIDQAIANASVTGEVPAPVQKPQVDATTVEVVSGATFSSKAVIRAIDEGYAWLLDYLK